MIIEQNLEKNDGKHQGSFRLNRSTTNQIFFICQVTHIAWEF